MSNTITIELCAEDRARLDGILAGLQKLTSCTNCVQSALTYKEAVQDDIQKKLADTLAKAETPAEPPKNATGEAEAVTAPIDHPAEEDLPWGDPAQPADAKPTVTLEQIQQKVVQLAAGNNGAKKAQVRAIVNAYAKKVSDLPEDKWSEVWGKLTALEKEV